MQALLGTRTAGDVNLVAQVLMLVALWIGFYFARSKQIPRHRNVQTTVVLVNMVFIAFFMITSFYAFVIAGGTTTGTVATLMMVHGFLGLIAELTGIYLILRMRTKLIPPRWRVRNFKLVMRTLIASWTLFVLLGFGIYYFRYLAPHATASGNSLAQLKSQADGISLHAEELQAAAQRNNLPTTKRHAEHLINLIEGAQGGDYGDLDHDGFVEDPGDGTGAINYLQQARDENSAGSQGAQVAGLAAQVRGEMLRVISDAKTVLQSSNLNAVTPQVDEIATVADQIGKGQQQSVPQLAALLQGSVPAPRPSTSAPGAAPAPNSITVDMRNFEYSPKSLTIAKGSVVVFRNLDNAKHTVTDDGGKFNSEDIRPGEIYKLTFDNPGSFPYHCEFHGDKGGVDMAGAIVVQP